MTVALLGPFGWGNLGDAAIQEAVIAQILARNPRIRIVGVSMVPYDTRRRHGIETFAYDTDAYRFRRSDSGRPGNLPGGTGKPDSAFRRAWSRIANALSWRLAKFRRLVSEVGHLVYVFRKLRQIDVLLISGGGQLDEFWGGPWQHPFTLYKWTLLARLTRTQVGVISVGAGTIDSSLSKFFLKNVLRLAQYRSYRDAGSKKIVREVIGFGTDDPVVPDMAFALPVSASAGTRDKAGKRLVVAIGPMPYCHPTLWPAKDAEKYRKYVGLVVSICANLLESDITLKFFVGEADQDPIVTRQIVESLAAMGHAMDGERVIIPTISDVRGLMECLADADVIVASRFHGVLLSLLLRKPVLAISYERKVRQLMLDLGQGQRCVGIDDATSEIVLEMFEEIRGRRPEIANALETLVERETRTVLDQFDLLSDSWLAGTPGDRRLVQN